MQDRQMTGSTDWLRYFPVALFATVMGLAGLTLVWLKLAHVSDVPLWIATLLRWLASGVYLMLLVLYLGKLWRYPQEVRADRRHPVKLNFFTAISIGLLLLSTAWGQVDAGLGRWMWVLAASVHLLFTLMIITHWMFETHQVPQINPAWFIPAVGNILVPIAGVHYAPLDISWFFFSVGLVFWVLLLTIIFYRLFFHELLAEKLNPTLFILLAPPSVGFLSYLALTDQLDAFARVLYFIALFIALLLLVNLRRFLRTRFFLSAWAYTFPLAAFSLASLEMYLRTQAGIYYCLGWLVALLVTAVVVLLVVKTLRAIISGKVFQPD